MFKAKTSLVSHTMGSYIAFQPGSRFANRCGMVKDVYVSGHKAYGVMIELPNMFRLNFEVPRTEKVTLMPKTKVDLALKKINPLSYIGSISYGGFTIGTDPELFVVDEHNVVIPAFTFLPTKKKAHEGISGMGNRAYMPYWDGFQGEWNTSPGYSCLGYLTDQVHHGMQELYKAAREKFPKARLTTACVVEIPEKMMKDADFEFVQLGCAPSLNVYNVDPIEVPDARDLHIRFAGCHLHFGSTLRQGETWDVSIKALDSVIGMVMTSLLAGLEDPRRRHFYGKAGEYRLPKHGFEYRVPSSALLCHPTVFHLCFDLARVVVSIARYLDFDRVWKAKEEEVVEIINNVDVKGARRILRKNKSTLEAILNKKYTGYTVYSYPHKKIVPFIMGGITEFFNVKDMVKTWYLDPSTRWATHSGNSNCTVDKLDISWFKHEDN